MRFPFERSIPAAPRRHLPVAHPRRSWPLALAGLACLTALPQAHALEALESYDTFGTNTIDPAKWVEVQSSRAVAGRSLRLMHKIVGSTESNSGTTGGSFGENFQNPAKVTDVGATIKVLDYEVTHCAANSTPGYTGARLLGFFFNIGTPVAGSNNNDVLAQFRVRRLTNSVAPANVLSIDGTVSVCNDITCQATTTLGTVDLGTVEVGTAVKALMRWDPAHNRFLFKRDAEPYKIVTYTVSDAAAPGSPGKSLGLRNSLQRCTAQPTTGFTSASFDNVVTNASALP